MRWLKQRNEFSCVPIAIMNLYKWLGHPVTYKDIKKFRHLCGTDRDGSERKVYERTIHTIDGIIVKRCNEISINKIKKSILDGKFIIMAATWLYYGERQKHMFCIPTCTDNSLFCVNFEGNHCWVNNAEFSSRYMEKWSNFPWAYVISKNFKILYQGKNEDLKEK